MPNPVDLSQVLEHMGYVYLSDFELLDSQDGNGPQIVAWHHADPEPTAQEIADGKVAWDAAYAAAAVDRRWDVVRIKRNRVLTATDWTQVPDSPLDAGQKTAYATWRDDLRDLPQDYPLITDAEAQLPILIAAEPTV